MFIDSLYIQSKNEEGRGDQIILLSVYFVTVIITIYLKLMSLLLLLLFIYFWCYHNS